MTAIDNVMEGVLEDGAQNNETPLPMKQRGRAAQTNGGDLTIAEGIIGLGKFFKITETGLQVKGKPSLAIWADMFEFLRICDHAIQFALGDALNRTEADFGEEASQLVDATKWSEETVKNYRWVSAKVPPQVRRSDLSFSHHQAVAHLDAIELQAQWLMKAATAEEPWSVAKLKKEMKALSSSSSPDIYSVTVTCDDAAQQDELVRQLANIGYEGDAVKVKKPS